MSSTLLIQSDPPFPYMSVEVTVSVPGKSDSEQNFVLAAGASYAVPIGHDLPVVVTACHSTAQIVLPLPASAAPAALGAPLADPQPLSEWKIVLPPPASAAPVELWGNVPGSQPVPDGGGTPA